ncbi:glycerophosphodiester phosphodiesterase family protein [Segniliparus rotundus]|nr:glycerophosphodiester phosphodiesterase family protein [Segniliparus rotundus]
MGLIRAVLMLCTVSLGAAADSGGPCAVFDLEAHRGGMGLTVESTLASFAKGLSVGVTTLEMDVQITKDHVAVITHDRKVDPSKCSGQYAGRFIKDLTFAQIETLDCGSKTLSNYPEQHAAPHAKMPALRSVLELARQRGPGATRLNIETKVEAAAPSETAPREEFVRIVAEEIRRAGLAGQAVIESFDWGALELMRRIAPELPLIALTSPAFCADETSRNPWLGGVALADFGGDAIAAAKSIGATAISPQYGDPQDGKLGDPGFRLLTTQEYVERAHAEGMKVIPWTVDDKATMAALVDSGADGIITDYPDALREVLAERDMPLSPAS